MSDLIILAFRDREAAFVAAENLAAQQQQAGTEPEDIVVISRTAAGRLAVDQVTDIATGGALGGGEWGMLIALLLLGGQEPRKAENGLAARFRETGVDMKFLDEAAKLPGKSGAALGMRVRLLGAERVVERAATLRGAPRIIRTRLDPETEERLIDLQAQIPRQVLALVGTGGAR